MSNIDTIKQCCKLFSAYNVKEIHADYDGSGDSGDINLRVVLHTTPAKIDAEIKNTSQPSTIKSNDRHCYFDEWVKNVTIKPNSMVTRELAAEFEEAVFDLLPGGWEINDGSYGEITIDIASERITLEHNERYTEVRSETFNF
jgi:hypothetical protein